MAEPAIRTVQAKDIHGNTYPVTTDSLRWRPSVYAFLIRDDKLLVLPQHGKYDLPGGGVEFGEMPEEALLRETEEETGLRIGNPRLLQLASSYFTMPNEPDQYIQSLLIYYVADIVGGHVTADNMDAGERQHVQQAEWLPFAELPSIGMTSSIDWRPFAEAARQTLY